MIRIPLFTVAVAFKELTFSSNFGDDSQVREALANELFRDRGVPAPRVAFYRVSVDTGNGPELWGLYTMVEDPADGAMLRSQFGSAAGNLYKPDGPGADWTRFDEASFEKKNRNTPDFTGVAAAIAALHAAGPSPQWRANLEQRLDVDHFLRWLAVNQVVDNWDAYGRFAHNYTSTQIRGAVAVSCGFRGTTISPSTERRSASPLVRATTSCRNVWDRSGR